MLSELLINAQRLVLTRNFSNNPQNAGIVYDTINAIQQRDLKKAISGLNSLSDKGKLTEQQQALIKAMLGDYGTQYEQFANMKAKAMESASKITDLF